MHQLHDRVNRIKQDKRLEVEYMTLEEILKKEFERGFKQGFEEGLKQAIEKARKQRDIEIAKNLLDILDDETIALKTGLTIEEVQRLRNENK